jgi:Protein of unknown function (DUF3071)
MQDIRLVDNDGEYLNLETQGGEKFRLVLDDSLRSAIKRDSQVSLDSVSISPREIQDEVRAGSSAEDVASRHSVPLDYVEKFALTVVDEIGHIIASAQAVRISVEADRYSEATQVEFGEVLESRLRTNDASNVFWSASKREGAPWMVSVSYDSPQGSKSAVWSFDQRKLILSPENEAAVKLSAGDFSAVTSSPKLRQLEPSVDATKVIELTRVEADEPTREAPDYSQPVAAVSSIEELTRSSLQAVEDAVVEEPRALSPTADLLEALRKKRASANASSPVEPEGVSETEPHSPSADAVEDSAQSTDSAATVEEVAPASVNPPAKKGRPSMPSWDEIVFGTKTDD